MKTAWRERNPQTRIKSAHEALEKNPECTPAYILLAEEEATSILEVSQVFYCGFEIYRLYFLFVSFSMCAGRKTVQAGIESRGSKLQEESGLAASSVHVF